MEGVCHPQLELIDPTPDIVALFRAFDKAFFDGALSARGVEVKWGSPRMTTCAGLCVYAPRTGMCSVRLSPALLPLRPRSDTVNTLLHEMVHALLFVTHSNTDHDDHGPAFLAAAARVNAAAGSNITVYHTFHDEVALHKTHWWRCTGPCRERPPYKGWVKRAMNRAPGPNDSWWARHAASCGGTFEKVRSPPPKPKPKPKAETQAAAGCKDIRALMEPKARGTKRPRPPPPGTVVDLTADTESEGEVWEVPEEEEEGPAWVCTRHPAQDSGWRLVVWEQRR